MPGFNLGDYQEVKDRIPLFLEKYPEGRILTMLESPVEALETVVFKALLYANADEQERNLPLASGWAFEHEGTTAVNRTSHVENCETSAIGRALANIGMHGSQRPSREEMEKVQRHEEGGTVTPIKPAPATNGDNLTVTWGKKDGPWYGMTFQQIWVEGGSKGHQYLHWVAEEAERMQPAVKKAARSFLDRQKKTPTMATTDEIVKLRELVEMAGADLEAYGEELRKVEAEYGGVPAAWVQAVADKMNKRLSDEIAAEEYEPAPEEPRGIRTPMLDEDELGL